MTQPPILIRVRTLDPVTEIGVLAQLRYQPEVVITDADQQPAVVLAILGNVDEQAMCWLPALRAEGCLPMVLLIGQLDPHALVASGLAVGGRGRGDGRAVTGQSAPDFAGLLRQLRAEAGLTQEELAQAARLGLRTVSDLERGVHRTARQDTARLLANALGLAEPTRGLFVAAARGKAPPEDVLAARREQAPGVFAAAGAPGVAA